MSFKDLSRVRKVMNVLVFIYPVFILLNSVTKYFIKGEMDGILIAAIATIPMAIIIVTFIVASKYQANK